MKLLIITQIVDKDDAILGFFHRWIEEFAKHWDQVLVICLKEGEHTLPKNVRVLSLGKESGASRVQYLFRFYKYIWQERRNYDSVFVHMNQIYVLLGGLVWRFLRKKVALWYAHGTVSASLHLARVLVHHIFTSTKEGCKIVSSKLEIVGQGIDCAHFTYVAELPSGKACTVGRISKAKNLEVLVNAVDILKRGGNHVSLDIYGEVLTEADDVYKHNLQQLIKKLGLEERVTLKGSITQNSLPATLKGYQFFLSAGQTGSLDKAILEAAAVGRVVVSSNISAKKYLEEVHASMAVSNNATEFAASVKTFLELREEDTLPYTRKLTNMVSEQHSLTNLAQRVQQQYA